MRFPYINRQVVAGFVGKSPELRHLPSGDAVLDLSVATTNSWKDTNGEWHDDTEWHNCIFYRKLAEQAAEVLAQGTAVYLEGRTYTREWEAKDQSKRKRKEVIVENFHVIQYVRSDKSQSQAATAAEQPEGDAANVVPQNMAGFDQ